MTGQQKMGRQGRAGCSGGDLRGGTVKDKGFDSYKPQASDPSPGIQLKAQPDAYRTILLYSETGKSDAGDIRLIEEAIEAFNKWTAIKKVPKYDEKIAYDYGNQEIDQEHFLYKPYDY